MSFKAVFSILVQPDGWRRKCTTSHLRSEHNLIKITIVACKGKIEFYMYYVSTLKRYLRRQMSGNYRMFLNAFFGEQQ